MRSYPWLLFFVSALAFTLPGCKSHARADQAYPTSAATVDLNSIVPIGYEFCEGRQVTFRRAQMNLTLRLPAKIQIPPSTPPDGVETITFHPGQHAVDLYKDLNTPRLAHTHGDVSIDSGVPTIRVQLDTRALQAGKYVLGISGDPVFAYCTVHVE